jgi:hypothetical protein
LYFSPLFVKLSNKVVSPCRIGGPIHEVAVANYLPSAIWMAVPGQGKKNTLTSLD